MLWEKPLRFVLPQSESLLSTLTYGEDGVNRAANALESQTRATQGMFRTCSVERVRA